MPKTQVVNCNGVSIVIPKVIEKCLVLISFQSDSVRKVGNIRIAEWIPNSRNE